MIRLMFIGITLTIALNAVAGAFHMAQKIQQARSAALEGR